MITNRPLQIVGITLCVAGCRVDYQGTYVGNPELVATRTAAPLDLTMTSAQWEVSHFAVTGCDGVATGRVDIAGTLDLLDGGAVELPPGSWCSVDLPPQGSLDIAADGAAGGTLAAELDVTPLGFSGLSLEGADSFVLEAASPGWLDGAALGVIDGAEIELVPADAEALALADAVVLESTFWEDPDADGILTDDERAAGELGTSVPVSADSEDDDTDDTDD